MFFVNDGLQLFALEAGVGGPPIVFLHANGSSHAAWHHQIAHFSRKHRVVAFDVRGQGESQRDPGKDYSQQTLARDLAVGMDALGLGRPVLVGWSVGALTATRYAATHPERVAGVVLVDNSPANDQIGLDPGPMQESIRLLETDFYGRGVEVYIDRWFPETGPEIDALRAWCKDICRKDGDESVTGIRLGGSPPDRLELLTKIQAPALILQGGASPGGRRMAEYLQNLVPNSRISVFEGSGHGLNMTRPNEFNRVLEEFIGLDIAR